MPTPHDTETKLADTYLETAVLGRELATVAMQLALKQAHAGELRDPAKTAMNAIITSGTALDKRLLLQDRPTVIHGTEDPKLAAGRLARRFGLTIDGTAEELEPTKTPNLALLSERVGVNARTPARDRSVSSPSD